MLYLAYIRPKDGDLRQHPVAGVAWVRNRSFSVTSRSLPPRRPSFIALQSGSVAGVATRSPLRRATARETRRLPRAACCGVRVAAMPLLRGLGGPGLSE